jgi:hypothetical protein
VPKLRRPLRGSAVEPEKPAKSLAALDRTASSRLISRRFDQLVANSLVIALAVVVLDELAHDASKVAFPDRNHLRQRLRLDGPNESLGIGVQIRTAPWELHGTYSGTLEDFLEALREEGIAVVNQVAASKQESVLAVGEISGDLAQLVDLRPAGSIPFSARTRLIVFRPTVYPKFARAP